MGLRAEVCRTAPQKSAPGNFVASVVFILPPTSLQGYQGAKETEQGKVSRLRDEAIKAAEDKKEEEKKREEEEREKKPGKDGIRVRLQMLQNRLTVQKTSDSVKQLMFERDLELEMLRRKKHYQTSASGWISFFLSFRLFHFSQWHKSAARLLPDRFLCCRILRRKEGRLKSNDAKAVGIHLKCDQSSTM